MTWVNRGKARPGRRPDRGGTATTGRAPPHREGGWPHDTGGTGRGRPAADSTGQAGWEHFAHDADIGLRGRGPTPERAFEQAALALTRVVTEAEIRPLQDVGVACEAPGLQSCSSSG